MSYSTLRVVSWASILTFAAMAAYIAGCSNTSIKPAAVEEEEMITVGPLPVNLDAEPGDKQMIVRWQREGEGLISGYNIYIGEEPVSRGSLGLNAVDTATPFNIGPYPGDTNPDDGLESFEATNLINGIKYYVTVRIIYPDGTLSPLSNEVVAVCGPRGEISLDQRYRGKNDGYSFEQNQFVRADASVNDLYYYTQNGTDYLASPRRLNGYLRKSQFARLELTGELKNIRPRLAKAESDPQHDKIAVKQGDWIHVRCEDNTNAVIRVLGFEGEGRDRAIRLFVAYCPVAGEMLF